MVKPASHMLRMVRRQILPSKSLYAYVAKIFFFRFFLLLTVLVGILQLMDLLNRSEEILAVNGATRASLITYISLRGPELISQFTPFAVMLATLFTLAGLNQSSEITIMRASGMSASQIMVPVVVMSGLVALGHGVFHEQVTVDNSKLLAHWRESGFQVDLAPPPPGRKDILLTDRNLVVKAARGERVSGGALLYDVTIYERSDGGDLIATLDASRALLDKGVWTLQEVRTFNMQDNTSSSSNSQVIPLTLPLERIFAELDRPDHAHMGELKVAIATLKASGVEAFALETSYYHRIALALSNMIMPLLAAFVAFGVPRAGATVGRVVLGMALGFSFFVVDTYMSAMGSLGVLPPEFASFAGLSIYTLIGLAMLARLE